MNKVLLQQIIDNNTSNSNPIAVKIFLYTVRANALFLDEDTNRVFLKNMCNEQNVSNWMQLYNLFTGVATGKTNIAKIANKCLDAYTSIVDGE